MYLPRELEEKVLSLWGKGRYIVIRGPRRSGKTTLLKRLQQLKGGSYISFEDPAEAESFLRDPVGYATSHGFPLFLDEVQHLGERGARALKLLYDKLGGEVVVSGSGAFDIKMKLSAHMVGRVFLLDLLPLSFRELTLWKGKAYHSLYREGHRVLEELLKGEGEPPEPSPSLEELFLHYAVWGGYPEVVLEANQDMLTATVETAIDEDIVQYFGLRERKKLWNVVRRLAAIAGNLLEYSSLGVDHKTAHHYLSILEASFILHLLPAFSTNKLVELSRREKVYFYDNGFRNALLRAFEPFSLRVDKGPLLENALLRQLLSYGELRYWRTKGKAEVDFVVIRQQQPLPVEVKVTPKVTPSLLSFIKRYRPSLAIVAAFQPFERMVGETRVVGVPPYYF